VHIYLVEMIHNTEKSFAVALPSYSRDISRIYNNNNEDVKLSLINGIPIRYGDSHTSHDSVEYTVDEEQRPLQ